MATDTIVQLRDQLRTEKVVRQKLESENSRLSKAQNEARKEILLLTQVNLEQERSIKILQAKIEELERGELSMRRQLGEKQSETQRARAQDTAHRKEAGLLQEEQARRKKLEALCRQYEHQAELYQREIEALQSGNDRTLDALRASEEELMGARHVIREIGASRTVSSSDLGSSRLYSVVASPDAKRPHEGGPKRFDDDRSLATNHQWSPDTVVSKTSMRSTRSRATAVKDTPRSRSRNQKTTAGQRPRTPSGKRGPALHVRMEGSARSGSVSRRDPTLDSPHAAATIQALPSDSLLEASLVLGDSPTRGRTSHRGNPMDPRNRSRSSERSAPGRVIKPARVLRELSGEQA